MRWLMIALLAVITLGCNRTPAGEPSAADNRPAFSSAPADWARRNGYDTGMPPIERRQEGGSPSTSTRAPQRR